MELQYCCDEVHQEALKDSTEQLPETVVERLAETFKALADPTRLRILHNLSKHELCVCDLASVLGMSQSAVSHQLRYLKALRLVKNRRDGNTIYYRHDDAHTMGLLQMAIDHSAHVSNEQGVME